MPEGVWADRTDLRPRSRYVVSGRQLSPGRDRLAGTSADSSSDATACELLHNLAMHHSCPQYRALLLAFAATTMIGCSAPASNPLSPSPGSGSTALTADQLAGTWTLSALQPAGQPEQAAPTGAVYNLTFADARLSARTDCNVCTGAFALADQTLVAGPALACTRAACPTMAFESQFTGLLSGESTAVAADAALTLSSARGTLRFTR